MIAGPAREIFDEVEQARICPLQVLEDEDGRRPFGDAFEEPAPGREQLVAIEHRHVVRTEQDGEARLDPASLPLVADKLVERRGQMTPSDLRRGVLADTDTAPDHLADRRECNSFPVRRSAAGVPCNLIREGVDPFVQLPRQAALTHSGYPGHGNQPTPTLANDPVEQLDQLAELAVSADERAGVHPALPARMRLRCLGRPIRSQSAGAALEAQ